MATWKGPERVLARVKNMTPDERNSTIQTSNDPHLLQALLDYDKENNPKEWPSSPKPSHIQPKSSEGGFVHPSVGAPSRSSSSDDPILKENDLARRGRIIRTVSLASYEGDEDVLADNVVRVTRFVLARPIMLLSDVTHFLWKWANVDLDRYRHPVRGGHEPTRGLGWILDRRFEETPHNHPSQAARRAKRKHVAQGDSAPPSNSSESSSIVASQSSITCAPTRSARPPTLGALLENLFDSFVRGSFGRDVLAGVYQRVMRQPSVPQRRHIGKALSYTLDHCNTVASIVNRVLGLLDISPDTHLWCSRKTTAMFVAPSVEPRDPAAHDLVITLRGRIAVSLINFNVECGYLQTGNAIPLLKLAFGDEQMPGVTLLAKLKANDMPTPFYPELVEKEPHPPGRSEQEASSQIPSGEDVGSSLPCTPQVRKEGSTRDVASEKDSDPVPVIPENDVLDRSTILAAASHQPPDSSGAVTPDIDSDSDSDSLFRPGSHSRELSFAELREAIEGTMFTSLESGPGIGGKDDFTAKPTMVDGENSETTGNDSPCAPICRRSPTPVRAASGTQEPRMLQPIAKKRKRPLRGDAIFPGFELSDSGSSSSSPRDGVTEDLWGFTMPTNQAKAIAAQFNIPGMGSQIRSITARRLASKRRKTEERNILFEMPLEIPEEQYPTNNGSSLEEDTISARPDEDTASFVSSFTSPALQLDEAKDKGQITSRPGTPFLHVQAQSTSRDDIPTLHLDEDEGKGGLPPHLSTPFPGMPSQNTEKDESLDPGVLPQSAPVRWTLINPPTQNNPDESSTKTRDRDSLIASLGDHDLDDGSLGDGYDRTPNPEVRESITPPPDNIQSERPLGNVSSSPASSDEIKKTTEQLQNWETQTPKQPLPKKLEETGAAVPNHPLIRGQSSPCSLVGDLSGLDDVMSALQTNAPRTLDSMPSNPIRLKSKPPKLGASTPPDNTPSKPRRRKLKPSKLGSSNPIDSANRSAVNSSALLSLRDLEERVFSAISSATPPPGSKGEGGQRIEDQASLGSNNDTENTLLDPFFLSFNGTYGERMRPRYTNPRSTSYFQSPQGASSPSANAALNKLFDSYRDDLENNPDLIGIEGAIKYLGDIGVQLDEVACFGIAELLQSPSMGEFPRSGFLAGWKGVNCETLRAQTSHAQSIRTRIISEPSYFRRVYRYTFPLCRLSGQKNLPLEIASEQWRLFFTSSNGGITWNSPSTPWLDWWLEFLDEKWKRPINKDLWEQTEVFMRKTQEDENFGWWSADGAWPGAIDDFITWVRERRGASSATAEAMEVE